MTDAADAGETGAAPGKRSRALLIAVPLALLLGGAAFYGVWSGLVPVPFGEDPAADADPEPAEAVPQRLEPLAEAGPPPGFVALEPMVVSLGPEAGARHLRLAVTVETEPARIAEIETLAPRIADVLNTFLRAVDPAAVERPRSMMWLRAQMLRRVRLVCPPGAVRDLLIQEFVLN